MSVSRVRVGRIQAALGENTPDGYTNDCSHTAAVEADLIRSTLP